MEERARKFVYEVQNKAATVQKRFNRYQIAKIGRANSRSALEKLCETQRDATSTARIVAMMFDSATVLR